MKWKDIKMGMKLKFIKRHKQYKKGDIIKVKDKNEYDCGVNFLNREDDDTNGITYCCASFLEIYQERLIDLIDEGTLTPVKK